MSGIPWLIEEPLASQEGLRSIDLVCKESLCSAFVRFVSIVLHPNLYEAKSESKVPYFIAIK